MASKAKMDAKGDRVARGVNPDDLKRVVGDILRNKETASEYAGMAGQSAKNAVENYNLDRKALSVTTSLQKAEPSKRQGTLRSIVEYAWKMGFFDQTDAFSDTIDLMKEIVADAEKRGGKPPAAPAGDGVMEALLN